MNPAYELEAPWQPIDTVPYDVEVNVKYPNGKMGTFTYRIPGSRKDAIAWCPIVKPTVKRWRAERGGSYYSVDDWGNVSTWAEYGGVITDARFAIGNYYQTRSQAEAALERVRKAYQGEQP